MALAVPAIAIFGNISSSPQSLTIDSNYLDEKGYSKCGSNCSEIEKGYYWAKSNDICDAKYYSSEKSNYYVVGVIARAWDDCAYSNNDTPI